MNIFLREGEGYWWLRYCILSVESEFVHWVRGGVVLPVRVGTHVLGDYMIQGDYGSYSTFSFEIGRASCRE